MEQAAAGLPNGTEVLFQYQFLSTTILDLTFFEEEHAQ